VTAYLVVEEVAEQLRCSPRTIHELTRTRAIPHRRLPRTRRCLFDREELAAWLSTGGELETIELRDGGRIVRIAQKPATLRLAASEQGRR
jgi:excisionase family DNA binding protein